MMTSHRSSRSNQFTMSKTFKPGFASPLSSAREERKTSAALLKVATFKTKNYDASEKYASAMSAR